MLFSGANHSNSVTAVGNTNYTVEYSIKVGYETYFGLSMK